MDRILLSNVCLKQSTIKSVSDVPNMAEELSRDFVQFNGHQELSLVLSKVNDILSDVKLRKPKQETLISHYFLLRTNTFKRQDSKD